MSKICYTTNIFNGEDNMLAELRYKDSTQDGGDYSICSLYFKGEKELVTQLDKYFDDVKYLRYFLTQAEIECLETLKAKNQHLIFAVTQAIHGVKKAHRLLVFNREAYNDIKSLRDNLDELAQNDEEYKEKITKIGTKRNYTIPERLEVYKEALAGLGFSVTYSRESMTGMSIDSFQFEYSDDELRELLAIKIEEFQTQKNEKISEIKNRYLLSQDEEREM